MRKTIMIVVGMLLLTGAYAQRTITGEVERDVQRLKAANTTFHEQALFTPVEDAELSARVQRVADAALLLRLEQTAVQELLQQRHEHIELKIGDIDLELYRAGIADDRLLVTTASGGTFTDEGLHYRGIVKGVPGSLAAVSIFGSEVMAMIADDQGTFTLGALENDALGTHVLYAREGFKEPPQLGCGTQDDGQGYAPEELELQPYAKTTKCVRFYWEVNYDIFQNKGSVTNATNYVTGLFNQSATLYSNDGINVLLSQVFVWDVASPYTSTSTSTLLNQFGAYRTSFNGDLAHLLGYAGGGGIAYLNGLCSSSTQYRMAYSGISSSYQNVPTYSWSVEVVTHEQGHLLGSKHTHACAWNGNNTAIDGCGNAAGYSEGSCPQGPIPSSTVGGTIMSYCHLTSSTIKFANGFGPQPTTLMVNKVNNATCLLNCAPASCGTPGTPVMSNITTTGATATWAAVSGAASYTLERKLSTASTWTVVTGITTNSYQITGLTAGTSYQVRVLAVCNGVSSSYSATTTFTTTATASCGTPGAPVMSGVTATTATATWTAVSGATSYTLERKLSTASTWTVVTGITGTSYQITGLTAGTSYQVRVLAVCNGTSSPYSAITSFTTTGSCGVPSAPVASAITTSSASITWGAVTGAISYTLGYKLSAASTWTTVTGITTTSSQLTGLAPGTSYQVRVLAVCSGASSAYTSTTTFTTVASCVDNYEPNGTSSSAPVVPVNTAITGNIGSSTDTDWFRFSNTSAQRNIRVTLTNLAANYDLRLYRSGLLLRTSANSGTTSEAINYNTSTVSSNYRVRVNGVNGAMSTTQCYTLTIQLSATAYSMPEVGDMPVMEGEEGRVATEMMLFPNPAADVLYVLIPANGEVATFQILDATGRVMNAWEQQNVNGEVRLAIDVSDLPPGMYILRATRASGDDVKRFVVER